MQCLRTIPLALALSAALAAAPYYTLQSESTHVAVPGSLYNIAEGYARAFASDWTFSINVRSFTDAYPPPSTYEARASHYAEAGLSDWLLLESIAPGSVRFEINVDVGGSYFTQRGGSAGESAQISISDASAWLPSPQTPPLETIQRTVTFDAQLSGIVPVKFAVMGNTSSYSPPSGSSGQAEMVMTVRTIRAYDPATNTQITDFTYRTASGIAYPLEGGTFAGVLEVPEPRAVYLIGSGLLLAAARRRGLPAARS